MNPQLINNRNQIFESRQNGKSRTAGLVYLPTGKLQSSRNFTALIGIAAGVIFAVFGFLFSVVLLFTVPPLAIVTCLFSIAGLAMAAGIGWWSYVKRGEKLRLTSDSLLYKSPVSAIEIQLNQINRLYPVQKVTLRRSNFPIERDYQVFYWCVRFEAATNNFLELDITQPNWLGTFDVGKLLRDLLPHLPISTQIDPRIYSYLQTGVIN